MIYGNLNFSNFFGFPLLGTPNFLNTSNQLSDFYILRNSLRVGYIEHVEAMKKNWQQGLHKSLDRHRVWIWTDDYNSIKKSEELII